MRSVKKGIREPPKSHFLNTWLQLARCPKLRLPRTLRLDELFPWARPPMLVPLSHKGHNMSVACECIGQF